jgi:hypothetical protein
VTKVLALKAGAGCSVADAKLFDCADLIDAVELIDAVDLADCADLTFWESVVWSDVAFGGLCDCCDAVAADVVCSGSVDVANSGSAAAAP